jgi:hypothetical protein
MLGPRLTITSRRNDLRAQKFTNMAVDKEKRAVVYTAAASHEPAGFRDHDFGSVPPGVSGSKVDIL